MKKGETFEEFYDRMIGGFKSPEHSMAMFVFFHSVYVYEHGHNVRRAVMRIKKLFEAYEKKGRDGTK